MATNSESYYSMPSASAAPPKQYFRDTVGGVVPGYMGHLPASRTEFGQASIGHVPRFGKTWVALISNPRPWRLARLDRSRLQPVESQNQPPATPRPHMEALVR